MKGPVRSSTSDDVTARAVRDSQKGAASHPLLAVALAAAAAVCWPLQEFTGGVLIRGGLPMPYVVGLRYIAHLALLGAAVLPLVGPRGFQTKRYGLQIARGLCMFGMPAGYIGASAFSPSGWIWTVFWISAVLGVALGALWLGDRYTRWSPVPLVLTAVAGWAIMDPAPAGAAGTVLAVVMGASFAGYLVLSRLLRHERLPASLLYTALGALAPMLLPVWGAAEPLATLDVIYALLTGALSLAILGFFDLALSRGSLWTVGGMLPLVLVVEVLFRYVVAGVPIFTMDVAGMIAALLALVVCIVVAARAGEAATQAAQP